MTTALDDSVEQFITRTKEVREAIAKQENEKRKAEQYVKEYNERATKAFADFRLTIEAALAPLATKLRDVEVIATVVGPSEIEHFDLNGEPKEHIVSLVFSNPSAASPDRNAVIRFLRGRLTSGGIDEAMFVGYSPDETGPLSREETVPIDFIMAVAPVQMWLSKIFYKIAQ